MQGAQGMQHVMWLTAASSPAAVLLREADGVQADAHPLFQRMSDVELANDPAACLLDKATEEGQKVARNSGLVCCCHAI